MYLYLILFLLFILWVMYYVNARTHFISTYFIGNNNNESTRVVIGAGLRSSEQMLIHYSLVFFKNSNWKKNILQLAFLIAFISFYLARNYYLWGGWSFVFYFLLLSFFMILLFSVVYKHKKKKKFREDFFNYLDLFISIVSSGRSMLFALDNAALIKDNIISPYMRDFSEHIRQGYDIETSVFYSSIGSKYPYVEIVLFFSVLDINAKRGAQLLPSINQLREDMSTQERLEGKLNSLTGEARMSRNILALLPVAFLLLMYFTNRTAFEWLFMTNAGLVLFASSSCLILIGVLICSHMVNKALS